MNNIFPAATLTLTLSLISINTSAAEHQHQHGKSHTQESSEHSKSSLVLNHGKKWPVDSVMKENMNAIYKQFEVFSTKVKLKKFSAKDANKLSETISISAKNIISKCKMPAKQDEAFHVILSDLFSVAADLKEVGKADPAQKKLNQTLENYSEYFDH